MKLAAKGLILTLLMFASSCGGDKSVAPPAPETPSGPGKNLAKSADLPSSPVAGSSNSVGVKATDAATGGTLSDRDVLVSWALSWYADDRVPNLDPLLSYTTWNTPQSYAQRSKQMPVPISRLTTTGAWSVSLGDPDVKIVEISPSQPIRLLVQATGALASRVTLELLRAQ